MDTCIEADIEDMLFGPDALCNNHDFASDVSEDEILDDAEDDEPSLWDLQDGPLLTPILTDREGEEHCGHTAQSLISRDEQVLPDSMRPARARWSTFTIATPGANVDRFWVIARIEGMLERIVGGLLEEGSALTFSLKSRVGISRRRAKTHDGDRKVPVAKQRDINFPGSTAQEAWNFSSWSQYLAK
jgi:meiotic recombination protein SPO11